MKSLKDKINSLARKILLPTVIAGAAGLALANPTAAEDTYVQKARYVGRYSDLIVIKDTNHNGNLETFDPIYTSSPDTQHIFVREYDNDFRQVSSTRLGFYGIPWAIDDLDNDGLLEMVVQSGDPGLGGNGYLRVYKQRNANSYPDNLIQEIVLPDKKVVYFADITDIDEDGKKEILMSKNAIWGGGTISIYEWDNNQLNLVYEYDTPWCVHKKAIGDFNKNGKLEVIFTQFYTGKKFAGEQKGLPVERMPVNEKSAKDDMGFVVKNFECVGNDSLQEIWSYVYSCSPSAQGPSFALDYDGDNKQEFLVPFSTSDKGYRYLLFKYEDNEFKLKYDLGDSTGFIGQLTSTVGDFNRDGKDEFVATIMPWWIRIYSINNGQPSYFSTFHECLGAYNADINHNGWPDLYYVYYEGSKQNPPDPMEIWENANANGVEQFPTPVKRGYNFEVTPSLGKIFNVKSSEDLSLYDIKGALIGKLKPGRNDLSMLPSGVYIISNNQEARKIVKLN